MVLNLGGGFFLCIYVFLLVRLDGEEDMAHSLLLYCFLATNVVIDCFSLLNFSTYDSGTYDLIKHHLPENSRELEYEKSQ